MLEFLFVVYLLILLIFPRFVLWGTLAVMGVFLIYRKYLLLKFQPAGGRKTIFLSAAASAANFLISLFLAFALAYLVNYWIFENTYLFLFNLIFSFAVSLRWFNFTHALYRHLILKQNANVRTSDPRSVFVTCLGFRKGIGWGLGLVPVFMDSGYLRWQDKTIVFDGVFLNHRFNGACASHVEKKSSEKIRIFLKDPIPALHTETLMVILKDQFYPFKSRDTRDRIFQEFSRLQLRQPA
ncbi:MAG: hypothetical protein ACE5G9_02540 [Nitrospinales bacterium]